MNPTICITACRTGVTVAASVNPFIVGAAVLILAGSFAYWVYKDANRNA
jgi:hypothetical protein